ncbi:MAG: type II toxin-antitoxin system VapB family antitoxin [Sphingomonas phyllosphaerae]
MRTNIDIDDRLMAQAMRITGKKTKRDAVHEALARLVELDQQAEIRSLRGAIDWVGDLDDMRTSKYIPADT